MTLSRKHKIVRIEAFKSKYPHSYIKLFTDPLGELTTSPFITDLANGKATPHHLYILSEDVIEQMDWYLDSDGYNIARRTLSTDQYEGCYRIIASTDNTLGLPSIHESFIEAYVINPVTEVLIDYTISEYIKENSIETILEFPKVDENDNIVILAKSKEIYTLREVKHLLRDFSNTRGLDSSYVNEYIKKYL